MRGIGLGTSIPTAALPGMGATMRSDGARIARARSSAREAMRPTFTPGPGATSYWVTTGPTVRPAIEPSTRNVCRVSMSFWPICSICTSPASVSSGGAGVNKSIGGGGNPPAGRGGPDAGGGGLGLRGLCFLHPASPPAPREAAGALEGRERPPDPKRRHDRGAGAERPPQQRADVVAPAPRDGKAQQRESEEQADDEGADTDQLLARLRVHVMRRSA